MARTGGGIELRLVAGGMMSRAAVTGPQSAMLHETYSYTAACLCLRCRRTRLIGGLLGPDESALPQGRCADGTPSDAQRGAG